MKKFSTDSKYFPCFCCGKQLKFEDGNENSKVNDFLDRDEKCLSLNLGGGVSGVSISTRGNWGSTRLDTDATFLLVICDTCFVKNSGRALCIDTYQEEDKFESLPIINGKSYFKNGV